MSTPTRSSTRRLSRRRRHTLAILVVGVLLIAAGVTAWALARPSESAPALDASSISWPTTGTAALAIGDDVAAGPDGDAPRPIASITKLVTALVVLDTIPLEPRSTGPAFAMTELDVQFADAESARGGRTAPVTSGDVLTLRQLLELVLVASSNNHATSLVTHVFGSEGAFLFEAQQWLEEHDLPDVRLGDASGMSPANLASAVDLLEIGRLALANPVIAEVTAMPAAFAPTGAPLQNTNDMLGTLGIDGLKTGHTDEAGHTMLFTAPGDTRIIGVVLGAPSPAQRTTDVTRLIASARALVEG